MTISKAIGIIGLIAIFLTGFLYRSKAQVPAQKEVKIFNFDEYDYYIYKGRHLTFEGVINAVVEERKAEFIAELLKTILKKGEMR